MTINHLSIILSKNSHNLSFQASTLEEVKPSHVRKRNFGATFADALDKANAEKLSDINDLSPGPRPSEDSKKERARGALVRARLGAPEDWDRLLQRASIIKPRFRPPDASVGSAGNAGPVAELNATEPPAQPRGRIRLKGSFLGIYSKGNTTPRTPRTDDDLPQRPDKRERIRNIRIRRPFISDSGKTSTTTKSTTTAASELPRAKSTTFTTTAPSSHEHSSLSSGTLTSSEKIINLKGIVKEYKEIVRTSSTSTTTAASTTTERDEMNSPDLDVSSVAESDEVRSVSDVPRTSTATTKRDTTTATTTAQDVIATASTTLVSETLPNLESSENAVISSESESVPDRASTSLKPSSIQSAVPSTPASLTVTESKELPGSSDMKQSKTHNKSVSQSESSQQQKDDITTRNPIEIQRPREELQKDLLEAIRRKISRNKQQLAAVAAVTQISVNQAETEAGGREAQQNNFISSTKNPPLFFRPGLSFPGSKKNSSTDPRIKIFVNLPPGSSKYQDPNSVKIPNISHIRSKIERLNDAINTGLKLERIREKEKEALENDWRQSEVQKTVVRSQSSSVQIVSQKSHQDSVHNDPGNQETIRKQSLAPSSSKSGIKNQFEPGTTTAETTTTAWDKTTTTTRPSTAATATVKDAKEEVEEEKLLHEHPSSHFRPTNWTRTRDFIPMPKSNLPPKEDVQLFVVTPKHVASYTPVTERSHNKHNDEDVVGNVVVGDQEPIKAEKETEAEDITNTTIIVIAVISVIPVAGLVAWGVRTVLRRKVKVYSIFKSLILMFRLKPFNSPGSGWI